MQVIISEDLFSRFVGSKFCQKRALQEFPRSAFCLPRIRKRVNLRAKGRTKAVVDRAQALYSTPVGLRLPGRTFGAAAALRRIAGSTA